MPLCSYGCGKQATFKDKEGRFICSEKKENCPGVQGKVKKTYAQLSYEENVLRRQKNKKEDIERKKYRSRG